MKTFLTLLIGLALHCSLMGQGIISFANNNATKISTNGSPMSSAPVGTWYYALFRAPSTKNSINPSLDPLFDGWTLVAIGTNTTAAGRLSGNNTTEGVAVTPVGPSTDDYALAGWSGNIGTTWADVQALFGNQPIFTADRIDWNYQNGVPWFGIAPTIADNIIANPTAGAINGLFGTTAGLIGGLSLNPPPIPEPSVAAFVVCAGGALLFQRKRARK